MADVRSLLRNELASRKGTSQPNTAGNRVSKKRKVDNSDGVMRKKLRSTSLEAVQAASEQVDRSPSAEATTTEILEPVEEEDMAGPKISVEDDVEQTETAPDPSQSTAAATTPSQGAAGTVDEDEWAAFEREVVAPTRMPHLSTAVAAEATISAAPMSAEELAAQKDIDKAAASRTREAELEGEREDAARFMEEEFDEMDQLEERVRRLKHMREELRQKRTEDQVEDKPRVLEDQQAAESESDEDEDEDWDDWRFK